MKSSTFFFLCILGTLVSCSNQNKKADSAKKIQSFTDTTFINNTIIDYYNKEFQNQTANEPLTQLKTDTSEAGIELSTILDTLGMPGPLNIIPFSSEYFKGDINNDKVEDYVIPVYATGGGTAEWEEIFVFISKNNKLEFFKMYSSFSLGHCEPGGSHDGQFYPEKIDNGIISGHSVCYARDDGHLSPSFSFTTNYKFDNGLIFLNQTKRK